MLTRVIRYIRKWLVFLPIIHRYRPWDYSYYLELNEAALKLIERAVFDEGMGLYTKRQRRDIKTAQEALRRLKEDKYTNVMEKMIVLKSEIKDSYITYRYKALPGFKHAVEVAKSRRNQDLELFTSIFKKRLQQWWD